jgi:hypothetical protein
MMTSEEKSITSDALMRLAAIEGLIRLARASVQLKAGDSAKLARADEDLEAALAGLDLVQFNLGLISPATAIGTSLAQRKVFAEFTAHAQRIGKQGG